MQSALVGLVGTIAGATIPIVGQPLLEVLHLGRLSMVDLNGRWDATWYVGEAAKEKLYARDFIDIKPYRGVRFKGRGVDQRTGYLVRGRTNSHGIVTFSYDSQERNFALVGGGVLQPDAKATQLSGLWHGYVQEGTLVSGRVVWRSERDTSRPEHLLFHAPVARIEQEPAS